MFQIIRAKRYMRNLKIFTIAVCLLIGLFIGLIAHVSIRDLLIAGLMAIGISFVVGELFGWLFFRFIYPQLRSSGEKLVVGPAEKKEMGIEYELKADDVLAFHLYLYERSPQARRRRKLVRRMLLLAFALDIPAIIIVLAVVGTESLPSLAALGMLALLTLLLYLFSPLLLQKDIRAAVARQYGQGSDKLTGKHKLSITQDGVTDITGMGESKTRWKAVEWVTSTDQYLFMTVRGSAPYIVPRGAFSDETTFSQFADTAKSYHQAAEAGN